MTIQDSYYVFLLFISCFWFFLCFSLYLVFFLFFSSSLRCMLNCFTLSRMIFNVLYHFRVARSSDLIFFHDSSFFASSIPSGLVFVFHFILFVILLHFFLVFVFGRCVIAISTIRIIVNRWFFFLLFFSVCIVYLSFSNNLFDFVFLSIDIELMRVQ